MKSEEALLKLTKLGLGHYDVLEDEDIEWPAIKLLAVKQGLTAVVLDGINEVRSKNSGGKGDRFPSQQFMLQWIGEVIHNYETRYVEYEKAIGSLAEFYNQHGYKMMVLKGYACSLDWSRPNHRPCGDIDIWQFGEQKEADTALAAWFKSLSGSTCSPSVQEFKIDSSHHHHTVFNWQGFMVENHYNFIDVHHRKSGPKLEALFKEMGLDDSFKVDLHGETVYLPSPNLHALFLIYHTMLHFTSTEMNIRQLLDWGLYAEKHKDEIDWKWLKERLNDFHLMDFYNIINAICVDDLGFDEGIFQGVQFNPVLKERVLNDTLSPEFTEEEPKNLMKRFFFRYRRWKSHEWKHKLCFEESMWSIFMFAVWSHILKPKSI